MSRSLMAWPRRSIVRRGPSVSTDSIPAPCVVRYGDGTHPGGGRQWTLDLVPADPSLEILHVPRPTRHAPDEQRGDQEHDAGHGERQPGPDQVPEEPAEDRAEREEAHDRDAHRRVDAAQQVFRADLLTQAHARDGVD